jgi:hypothetical protein
LNADTLVIGALVIDELVTDVAAARADRTAAVARKIIPTLSSPPALLVTFALSRCASIQNTSARKYHSGFDVIVPIKPFEA